MLRWQPSLSDWEGGPTGSGPEARAAAEAVSTTATASRVDWTRRLIARSVWWSLAGSSRVVQEANRPVWFRSCSRLACSRPRRTLINIGL